MKMARYYYDTAPLANIEELCKRFGGKALQSPYRSTVPLLSLVQHSEQQWRSLLDSLGAPPNVTVHFEYRVPSPKPDGNPSQTDALLISDSAVWAVEAKWTEPRYQTVARRISAPEEDGGDPRITVNGWLKHLQAFATRDLRLDDFLDVVYQVLHRVASACAVAASRRCRPELVYLHFQPSPLRSSATTSHYIADLQHLYGLTGRCADLRLSVVEMPVHPTAAFEKIQGLDKRLPATAAQVSASLCDGPLFSFGTPVITRI